MYMYKSSVFRNALFTFVSVVGLLLFLYSYTQVDLALTLTQASIWQSIQKGFQYVGYFNRPLSTFFYLVLIGLLFVKYSLFIYLTSRNLISEKHVRLLILIFTVLVVLSYPAFSKDLFNYMFTAKTVLVYNKNPYTVVPLQFTGVDPWLSFLHWTHLPSAYTPLWILTTLPAFILGYGVFLLTMWNFKLLAAFFYVGTAWCIGEIVKKRMPGKELLSVVLFAFNPLVIIEVLVNGHNDISMMFFAMLSILVFEKGKHWISLLMLGLSAGFKTITAVLFPTAITGWNRMLALGSMVVTLMLVITQREILPWYFLWIIPFVALLPERKEIVVFASCACLGQLLRYAPYLYFGNWNTPVQMYIFWGGILPTAVGAAAALILFVRNKKI